LGATRVPANPLLTRRYLNQFGVGICNFVQSNSETYYYVRGQKIRIKDEAQVNKYYDLADNEKSASPFDLWDRSVLKVFGTLGPEETADLRNTVLKTNKLKAVDRMSLEQVFKESGLSTEAMEMLSATWAYETMLQSGIAGTFREEYEETWIKNFDEIVGGTDILARASFNNPRNKPRMGCKVVRIEQNSGGATDSWMSPGRHEKLYPSLIAPEGPIFMAGEHASLTPTWI